MLNNYRLLTGRKKENRINVYWLRRSSKCVYLLHSLTVLKKKLRKKMIKCLAQGSDPVPSKLMYLFHWLCYEKNQALELPEDWEHKEFSGIGLLNCHELRERIALQMGHRNNWSAAMHFYGETWSENLFRSHRKAVCNNFIVALKAPWPTSEERIYDVYQSFYLSSA